MKGLATSNIKELILSSLVKMLSRMLLLSYFSMIVNFLSSMVIACV